MMIVLRFAHRAMQSIETVLLKVQSDVPSALDQDLVMFQVYVKCMKYIIKRSYLSDRLQRVIIKRCKSQVLVYLRDLSLLVQLNLRLILLDVLVGCITHMMIPLCLLINTYHV